MEPTQPYYLGPTPLIVPAPEPAPAWVHNLDMRLDLCDAHHLVPVPSEQFVIVRRLKRASDSGSRWQVAQIVPSIELPPIFDNNSCFGSIPCRLFVEQTGTAAGDPYYFHEGLGEILCVPDGPQTSVAPPRISSLDFVWVIDRHPPGKTHTYPYHPAMFIRDVSATECQVMLLEEDNQNLRRLVRVPRQNLVLWEPPSGY